MMDKIREKIASEEYCFLRENKHLGENIILLGLGGSFAYGTNTKDSDLDIRGCALNTKTEILLGDDFEQFVDKETDTTIYSFRKLIRLLVNANPNIIELLGLKPEHYLHISDVGRELLDNKGIFLSKKVVHSFGGYASQQLYRLQQKASGNMNQPSMEEHILKRLEHMEAEFPGKYTSLPDDAMRLYIDQAAHSDLEREIFMDLKLTHYPLRDYCGLWSELQNTVKNYNKIGSRNQNADTHKKMGKHSMHLIRLYMMCLDILEHQEIVTYRAEEHDLLVDIRNGKYLSEDGSPTSEFFDMVRDYENRLDYASRNTSLPEQPDTIRIREFVLDVQKKVVRGYCYQ